MATTQHHSRFAEKARCAAHGGDKAAAQGRGPGKRAQAGRATGEGRRGARGEGRRAPLPAWSGRLPSCGRCLCLLSGAAREWGSSEMSGVSQWECLRRAPN